MKQAENAGKRTNFVEGVMQWVRNPNKDLESDEKEGGETGEPQGNGIRRKYRKYRLKKMERNMKEGKYTGKIKNLTVPGNENKNKMMTTIVEYDGEENRETAEPQPKKCENPTSNTDTTNTRNSCTSTSSDIDNGKVTNMEIKSITNDEGKKGKGSETEAETEAEAEAEAEAETDT